MLCGLLPFLLLRPLPLSSGFLPHIPMVIPDIVAWYRDWPHSMIFEFRSLNILVWPDTTSYRQQFLTHHSNCRWESGRGRGWIISFPFPSENLRLSRRHTHILFRRVLCIADTKIVEWWEDLWWVLCITEDDHQSLFCSHISSLPYESVMIRVGLGRFYHYSLRFPIALAAAVPSYKFSINHKSGITCFKGS